ncbi:MAG: hypothetical protein ACREDV_09870 [Methylocella sp.]
MANINHNYVLYDFWCCSALGDILYQFKKYAAENVGQRLVRFILRYSALRALLLIRLGRDFQLIAPDWFRDGRLICVLHAILRNRNIVIFECVGTAVWKGGHQVRLFFRTQAESGRLPRTEPSLNQTNIIRSPTVSLWRLAGSSEEVK